MFPRRNDLLTIFAQKNKIMACEKTQAWDGGWLVTDWSGDWKQPEIRQRDSGVGAAFAEGSCRQCNACWDTWRKFPSSVRPTTGRIEPHRETSVKKES